MNATMTIELAHATPFRIGPIEIHPSTREVRRDGETCVIEPRVMQVLVALHEAGGGVVTRDELVRQCWDGRIVGDDAIHRVLSRLRRLSEGMARGAFRIETITKVGYRLVSDGVVNAAEPAASAITITAQAGSDRRGILAVGAAGLAAIAGGVWWQQSRDEALPEDAKRLLERGFSALQDATPEQIASGVALIKQATEVAPGFAEPWGALAAAYQQLSLQSNAAQTAQLELRAKAAAERAISIDPDNAEATVVLATLQSWYRNWWNYERACQRLMTRFPRYPGLNARYGAFLSDVGRSRDALERFETLMATDPLSPRLQWTLAYSLKAAGRPDEADQAIDRAFSLWPRHYAVWFVRFRLLSYSGRSEAALAMVNDRMHRPLGIPDWNFKLCSEEATALGTRAPEDIEVAMKTYARLARTGVGFAQNAILFAATVGRVDEAFAIAAGYYFNRGFRLGDKRYSEEQGMYDPAKRRMTYFLFAPETASLRADPRFLPLLREIGIEAYWQASGKQPDFRRFA